MWWLVICENTSIRSIFRGLQSKHSFYLNKMSEKITQSMPNFGKEEAESVFNYMNKGGFITEYKETTKLEEQLCEYIGTKHCIMTTSGTTAIILSLMSLNIGKGDEVIVPNYTMIATINAVTMTGAIPIIIDVSSDTFTISLESIKNALTKKTKAVIHVSLNNRCDKLEDIVNFCEEKNIYLVEDSAQSLGCLYNNKYFGTYG